MRKLLLELFVNEIGLNPDDFSDDLTYNSIPEWDSTSHMLIVLAIEEKFGVALDSDEVVSMSSVRKIVNILQGRGITID